MGLFSFFKKPTIIHDHYFGPLLLVDFKDASKNYFEGKGYFAPADSETEYLIHAGMEGPTEQQKEFYKNLQADFAAYIIKMKPLIENEFRNWHEQFEIKDFGKEFKLVNITIPRLDNTPAEWDMSFTTLHDLDHHITVYFVGDQPTGILVDG
ncbi:MAG: hypothetical protein JNM88_13555 [Chitinophagaceae bacterium]|nr:hypothetical protein [Chitinophagaceae bacterium]